MKKLKGARILSSHVPNIFEITKSNSELLLNRADISFDDIQKQLISKDYVSLTRSVTNLVVGSDAHHAAVNRIIQYFQSEVNQEKGNIAFFNPVSNDSFNSEAWKNTIQNISSLDTGFIVISSIASVHEDTKSSIELIKSTINSIKQIVDQKLAFACIQNISRVNNKHLDTAEKIIKDIRSIPNGCSFELPNTISALEVYQNKLLKII